MSIEWLTQLVTPTPWVAAPSWLAVVWILIAMLLLDFFDISLPRGDSVGVAGALVGAAIVMCGPAEAFAIAAVSAVAAHGARRGMGQTRRLLIVLLSRALGTIAAAFALASYPIKWQAMGAFTLVPAVFLVVELVSAQAIAGVTSHRAIFRLVRGNAASQAPLLAAQWSASALLLLTYSRGMGYWSLIPVVILLLLIRQSYAQFLDIRETYRATVEVLVEAAESQDERRAGHADRTAVMARSIASRLGLSAAEVERVSYAALLHDLGELSEDSLGGAIGGARHFSSAEVVKDVEFFHDVEPILRVCDGQSDASADDKTLLAALIVALATDIDAAASPQVGAAHKWDLLDTVAPLAPRAMKARTVAAALELGYRTPAVG